MAGKSGSSRERRRSERYAVQDVQGTLHLSTDARILNMSMTGMAVATDAQLPVGRRYAVTFRCASGTDLRLPGSVAWCRPRETSPTEGREIKPICEAGFRFDHTLGQRAADLARILQAVSNTEVSKRTSGRFKVDAEEPVNLYAAFHFAAKNVSTGGILVETDEFPPLDTVVDAELGFREHALRTKGRIARIHETTGVRGERLSQLGIEFIERSADGREAIRRFVDRCIERSADEAAG